MNAYKLNSQIDFVENYENDFLNSETNKLYIVTLDNTEVVYGKHESCNIEYCDCNNIKYINQDKLNTGGCIVGIKGNIFIDYKYITHISRDTTDLTFIERITKQFSNALCEYFKSKCLDSAICDNNDVLIDGYKVASGCQHEIVRDFKFIQYMGYQISIYQDLDLINHVCNKEMKKIPKALSEYGITTEEMVKFIEDFYSNK